MNDSGSGHPRCVATILSLCSEVFGLLYSGKTKVSTLLFNCFCYYIDVHDENFGYLLCSCLSSLTCNGNPLVCVT